MCAFVSSRHLLGHKSAEVIDVVFDCMPGVVLSLDGPVCCDYGSINRMFAVWVIIDCRPCQETMPESHVACIPMLPSIFAGGGKFGGSVHTVVIVRSPWN
jgi:hypothetical protein